MTDAQLFWDKAEGFSGWWFRYTDGEGNRHESDIEAPHDAGLAELASALPGVLRGRVRVYRNGETRLGTIWISDDGTDWRYD